MSTGHLSFILPPPPPPQKPHLHEIVNRSMSLANTAQDPCNYFLLLRALFRSIGGGELWCAGVRGEGGCAEV